MDILLAPLLAFLIYLAFAGLLNRIGRLLAGSPHPTPGKSSVYACGEAPPARSAAPGYRPFFVIALFFAVLHLGVLVMSSGGLSPIVSVYLVGLLLVLATLLLG